ncbi:MAG: cobalamin B12-binding domain-containing protein [Actinobacteria bacterium]|nr:cobalamin B12-binding domain-containing protein [Actinomycetota bacterium]
MSTPALPPYLVAEFVERLATGDRIGAMSRTLELLEEGRTRRDVRELIRRAQLEVGQLWQSNTWTVAQEHVATGISETVLHAAGAAVLDRHADRGSVLVVCADGEWHVLPARLLAEDLLDAGFEVTFAGGSVPPEHLVDTVRSLAPDAVAVSCTLSLHLAGAARTIAAAHAGGRPVLAGGTAFGADERRARALGADAWAADLDEAAGILAGWAAPDGDRPEPGRAARREHPESAVLYRSEARLVDAAYEQLAARFPDIASYTPWQVARTREDLRFHLRYLASAVLLEDDGIYLDMLPWLTDLLEARGVPGRSVELTVAVLAGLAEDEGLPATRRLLGRAAERA